MQFCCRNFRTNEGSLEYEIMFIFKSIDEYETVLGAKALHFMEPIPKESKLKYGVISDIETAYSVK